MQKEVPDKNGQIVHDPTRWNIYINQGQKNENYSDEKLDSDIGRLFSYENSGSHNSATNPETQPDGQTKIKQDDQQFSEEGEINVDEAGGGSDYGKTTHN
jgi:hypothetical protein